MRSRQAGMTFLGVLVLIFVVGTWVYAGMRVAPVYLEYMKIASSLEKVRDEYEADPDTTEAMLRNSLERHFDVESVSVMTQDDVAIKRDGGMFRLTADYEQAAPFVFNISFLLTFNKTVEFQAR